MTVKFEFILSDVDASNLIGILQYEKARTLAKSREFIKPKMNDVDRANLDWYEGHAEYLEELKQKVAAGTTRVS